jgi:hypothetical protein
MKKLMVMIFLLIILLSCTRNTSKKTSFSEEYSLIYTALDNCIIKYIGENIITDINFDFGYNTNNVKELNLLRVYLYFDYGYYDDKNTINNIIENDIINELFNIFYEESNKVLKISDISIVKYYPFKIKFKKGGEYSKEEIELLKSNIYEKLGIPIFEIYEYYCEGYIGVKGNDYLNIEEIKYYVGREFEIEDDIEI